jgi:hypothetical protein
MKKFERQKSPCTNLRSSPLNQKVKGLVHRHKTNGLLGCYKNVNLRSKIAKNHWKSIRQKETR